jgi:hypothetical protein
MVDVKVCPQGILALEANVTAIALSQPNSAQATLGLCEGSAAPHFCAFIGSCTVERIVLSDIPAHAGAAFPPESSLRIMPKVSFVQFVSTGTVSTGPWHDPSRLFML